MYPARAGEVGWIELSTGFPFGSEQSQLPCNNMYLLEKAHRKIFAPADPVIRFRPKGNTRVRTEMTQHLLKMSQRGEVNHLLDTTWKVGQSLKSPLLGSPRLIIMASSQVILWYSERLF